MAHPLNLARSEGIEAYPDNDANNIFMRGNGVDLKLGSTITYHLA